MSMILPESIFMAMHLDSGTSLNALKSCFTEMTCYYMYIMRIAFIDFLIAILLCYTE